MSKMLMPRHLLRRWGWRCPSWFRPVAGQGGFAETAAGSWTRPVEYNKWRAVWIVVLFDLPVKTKADRHEYVKFRDRLLDDGFAMMQYSVYYRHSPSEENAAVHDARVGAHVPPGGEVRIIHFTDAQFGRMRIYCGKQRKTPEKEPAQLELF